MTAATAFTGAGGITFLAGGDATATGLAGGGVGTTALGGGVGTTGLTVDCLAVAVFPGFDAAGGLREEGGVEEEVAFAGGGVAV